MPSHFTELDCHPNAQRFGSHPQETNSMFRLQSQELDMGLCDMRPTELRALRERLRPRPLPKDRHQQPTIFLQAVTSPLSLPRDQRTISILVRR